MKGLLLIAVCCCLSSVLWAQSLEQRLIDQEELSRADINRLGAFDTLAYGLDLGTASVDTSVVISDSVLYAIIMVGDASGTSASFYLMSFDRIQDRPIQLQYVCNEPDIDQSLKRYSWTDHHVGSRGDVWAITYDCRTRKGDHRNRELVEMKAEGRRIWTVARDGRIQGGEWIAEKR